MRELPPGDTRRKTTAVATALDLQQARRCHFAAPLIATLKGTWAIIVFLIVTFFREISALKSAGTLLLFAALGLVVLLLLILVFNVLRWRRIYIYFSGRDLVVERRLAISQSRTTLRPESVASINIQQGVLERLFRVSRLQFDLNSAATADKTDFDLIFSTAVALAYQQELERLRMTAEVAADPVQQDMRAASEFLILRRFTCKEVARHALLGTSLWSIFYTLVSVPLYFSLSLEEALAEGMDLSMLIGLVIAFGPVFSQMISPLFRYYGFTLARLGNDRVQISYGLFTRRQFTLPLAKTNAIVLRQPFFARLFGLSYGEIINVGMGDAAEGIAPAFCLLTDVREMSLLLDQIAPQFRLEQDILASPKKALPISLLRYAPWALAGVAAAVLFARWWIGLIWFCLLMVSALFSWRTKGLCLMEDRLAICNGIFNKRTIITFYAKLQSLKIVDNPLARRLGLAWGVATILAEAASRTNTIGCFSAAELDSIAEKMLCYDSNGLQR